MKCFIAFNVKFVPTLRHHWGHVFAPIARWLPYILFLLFSLTERSNWVGLDASMPGGALAGCNRLHHALHLTLIIDALLMCWQVRALVALAISYAFEHFVGFMLLSLNHIILESAHSHTHQARMSLTSIIITKQLWIILGRFLSDKLFDR